MTAPSLVQVYQKFGEVSELAQLLETELASILFFERAVSNNLIRLGDAGIEIEKDPACATSIMQKINRHTLGQLLKGLKGNHAVDEQLEKLLWQALQERNRLQHSFYRQHNFRRNSDEGCSIMFDDLIAISQTLEEAYRAVMLLSGVDLHTFEIPGLPTEHVPI